MRQRMILPNIEESLPKDNVLKLINNVTNNRRDSTCFSKLPTIESTPAVLPHSEIKPSFYKSFCPPISCHNTGHCKHMSGNYFGNFDENREPNQKAKKGEKTVKKFPKKVKNCTVKNELEGDIGSVSDDSPNCNDTTSQLTFTNFTTLSSKERKKEITGITVGGMEEKCLKWLKNHDNIN